MVYENNGQTLPYLKATLQPQQLLGNTARSIQLISEEGVTKVRHVDTNLLCSSAHDLYLPADSSRFVKTVDSAYSLRVRHWCLLDWLLCRLIMSRMPEALQKTKPIAGLHQTKVP